MRRGFTLIELLVATALSVALVALVAGSMLHASRTAGITGELLAMHDAAAGVERVLAERLQAQIPATSWHLTADAGADGAWGTGDERCSLTFMASSRDRQDRAAGFAPADVVALNWYRLSWQGPDAAGAGSALSWAQTTPTRTSREWNDTYSGRWWPDPASSVPRYGYRVTIQPEPRRDRRRDLDDNDLRGIEGMTPARWGGLADGGGPLPGDDADLRHAPRALLHPSLAVEDLLLGWIDRAGYEVRFDPALGIVRRDALGNPAPWPAGAPWASRTRVSLDGVFTDARAWTMPAAGGEPADTRDSADSRPAVLRLAFTLRRPPPPTARAREPLVQRFAYAIPLQPGLPRPASTWPRGIP